MMSREKQIEEMASRIPARIFAYNVRENSAWLDEKHRRLVAEIMYNEGYRKQSAGHWEIVKGSNGKEKMVCTNCRHQQDLASTFTYCPNCGAKMGGGE